MASRWPKGKPAPGILTMSLCTAVSMLCLFVLPASVRFYVGFPILLFGLVLGIRSQMKKQQPDS